jgi:SAM-dependent methyltransferase
MTFLCFPHFLTARGGRNLTHTIELDGHSLVTPESIAIEVTTSGDIDINPEVSYLASEILPRLDDAAEGFKKGGSTAEIGGAVTILLHEVRNSVDVDVWRALIPIIQAHPVAKFFLEDPITKWSFERPRGYSGDAHLLDLIYRHPKTVEQVSAASPLGREVYEFTSHAPSSFANCDRRDILARFVDETAARVGRGAEVLSFAAGHLREAEVSKAHADRTLGRWVAVDQDPLSIAEIEASYAGTTVQPVKGSVRDLFATKLDLGKFDLVYASGLYDYLADKVAVKLTQRLAQLVKPGGTFLFANYSHPIVVDGYLETFMDWTLLLRSDEDIRRIAVEAVGEEDWIVGTFYGENRNIVYATLTRR